MTQITNHSEYVSLINTLKAHDYRYFTLNAPTITDEEYDRLYFAIQDYETAHPEQTLPDSPTQSAHAEVKNGHKQILRRTEMLSTEKAQTIEKVQKWMQKTTKKLATVPGDSSAGLYTVEWKYDGISLSLVYIDGQLTEASYGKGIEGNDCLAHCLKVQSIPNTINATGRVEVRGEMVVPFANLAKTGYKNCRSAASGIMADTASTLTDCLEFIAYWSDLSCNSHYSTIEKLSALGFEVRVCKLVGDVKGIEFAIQRMTEERDRNEFPTDGIVVKLDDRSKWDTLGRNDHHPHYAIAYKFAAATAETTIKDIQINIGKTGKRTPVAYFEPITINGSNYQKASIGSEAKLAELGIAVGSRVIVSLRNDVIPHIDQVVPQIAQIDTDDNSCGSCNLLTEEKENLCPSVESVREEPDSEPIARYIAPEVKPVMPSPEPICAPQQGTRRTPKRNYRMVGESRTRVATETVSTPSPSNGRGLGVRVFSYVFATLVVIAFIILCFAGLGAAVFFLPLLAGAFK